MLSFLLGPLFVPCSRFPSLFLALLLPAVTLAACGGDDSGPATEPQATAPVSPTAGPEVTMDTLPSPTTAPVPVETSTASPSPTAIPATAPAPALPAAVAAPEYPFRIASFHYRHIEGVVDPVPVGVPECPARDMSREAL